MTASHAPFGPTGRAAASPELLEAQLYGLEETLRILRADLDEASPIERARAAHLIRNTRVRMAKIRLELVLRGRPVDGHGREG